MLSKPIRGPCFGISSYYFSSDLCYSSHDFLWKLSYCKNAWKGKLVIWHIWNTNGRITLPTACITFWQLKFLYTFLNIYIYNQSIISLTLSSVSIFTNISVLNIMLLCLFALNKKYGFICTDVHMCVTQN